MISGYLRRKVAGKPLAYARSLYDKFRDAQKKKLPPLTEEGLTSILLNDLCIRPGDVIFVHSSINNLFLAFPFFRVLPILQAILGREGTLIFPTYPRVLSYNYLANGEIFDVRKTPSYTGVLTEFARRQRTAIRSLHPTKSVCAIGPRARFLTESHQNSPYPYDSCSPYFKLAEEKNAKIVGLGVTTHHLSFVHCVDDALKGLFPIQPYHKTLFYAKCINYDGNTEIVKTFAHDMKKMDHNIPRFMRRHIPKAIGHDQIILGRNFYTVRPDALFERMLDLAKRNITIYRKRF